MRILGIKDLTEYFVNQVQEVYRLQGVVINDKHIETILRQMLKKVEIKQSGDSSYLPGEMIDRIKFDNALSNLILSIISPGKYDESPDCLISTFLSICLNIVSMCLSLITTPCNL